MNRDPKGKIQILAATMIVSLFFLSQCAAAESTSTKVNQSEDFKFLLGNWNPSDAGKDNPSLEEYRWSTTRLNGRRYKATNDDIYFSVVRGIPVIGGQGGRLEVTAIRREQQVVILTVLREAYGMHKSVKGEVSIFIQDKDQIQLQFRMPDGWDDAFGREGIPYLRAAEVS